MGFKNIENIKNLTHQRSFSVSEEMFVSLEICRRLTVKEKRTWVLGGSRGPRSVSSPMLGGGVVCV